VCAYSGPIFPNPMIKNFDIYVLLFNFKFKQKQACITKNPLPIAREGIQYTY
jgi:hypothetical protein